MKRPVEFPFSQAVFGCLLRAYPQRHREEYGAAMAQIFRDQCRDAWKESQNLGLLKLWLRVLPDLARTSILERLAALKERKTMTQNLANLSSFRGASLAPTFFKVFVPVFLVVVLASVAITFILPETYASTARIKIEKDEVDAKTIGYDPYFIQTSFEIIRSATVLNPVIAQLHLNEQWGKKFMNGQVLKTSETLEILRQRLQLAPVRNTKLVSVTIYSDDKVEAAQIANAIAEAYREYRIQTRAELVGKALGALQQEYERQEASIWEKESELESMRQQGGIASDSAVGKSVKDRPYGDKQRELSQLLDVHKLLFVKIQGERLDVKLPKSSMVQITDPAEPGRAPVKPNKTVNIVLGTIAGVLLASAAGVVIALLSLLKRGRTSEIRAAA